MPCTVSECGRRGAIGADDLAVTAVLACNGPPDIWGVMRGRQLVRSVGWAKRSVPTAVSNGNETAVGTALRAFAHPTNPREYRHRVYAPNIGMRFTASTTANVITSMAMPSTAIAARSPLSLRS